MMARNEFTTADYLQPAAGPGVATGGISIEGLREISGAIQAGGFKLDIELDEAGARGWLRAFAQVIADLSQQRSVLAISAAGMASNMPIGNFDTSNWVKQRIAIRLGGTGEPGSTEGLADVIGVLVDELQRLQDAFRVALAEHLGADLEGERVMNQLSPEGHG